MPNLAWWPFIAQRKFFHSRSTLAHKSLLHNAGSWSAKNKKFNVQKTSAYYQQLLTKLSTSIIKCFAKTGCAITDRFASSQWACLPAYSESVLVSSLVITSWDMSIRLHSKSDMVCLAYSTAPFGSRSIRIFCRQQLIRLATSGQLSRRTVSIPLQSILSCTSGRVKYRPAYRFLLMRRYGK